MKDLAVALVLCAIIGAVTFLCVHFNSLDPAGGLLMAIMVLIFLGTI